ncbi:protein of unknown function [Pseudorhizobium banfieldiae]|uniref:Uncharacterized protein n=1 Tax=Pseudorhizobium banfieldiae TaxID=1125847 RepID=L0NJW5_9HYPH|nr:protein of unknown function [Pseudorhizobium banfieldiae]
MIQLRHQPEGGACRCRKLVPEKGFRDRRGTRKLIHPGKILCHERGQDDPGAGFLPASEQWRNLFDKVDIQHQQFEKILIEQTAELSRRCDPDFARHRLGEDALGLHRDKIFPFCNKDSRDRRNRPLLPKEPLWEQEKSRSFKKDTVRRSAIS